MITTNEWKYVKEISSENRLKEVEEILKIEFPDDLATCILMNNGGRPKKNTFDMENRKEAIFHSLLSINEKDKGNILEAYNWIKDGLPGKVYPFANDPFGNYICLDFSKKVSYIIFWNHENKNITVISNSFEEFLAKLY